MKRLLTIYLILFLSSFSACKKYKDGPVINLRSKKERVANTWKVDKASNRGTDISIKYDGERMTFTKEGYFFYFFPGASHSPNNLNGTWEFSGNKKAIILTTTDNGTQSKTTLSILRLKENEMWVKQGDTLELKLIPS